jgi:hypothetical protein
MTPVPEAVAYVRDLLVGFDPPWFLCGGWAVDAWLGEQTRHHADVDIAVFHRDQRAVFEQFPGWELVGHDPNVPDDTTEPWNGRHLDLPAHVHVRRDPAFEFELLLNERTDHDWVLERDPRISVPLDRAVRPSAWGLPTAAPEVVLFYKAGETPRPHDERDMLALLPTLTEGQRTWLRESLVMARPGHPWLRHLRGAPA